MNFECVDLTEKKINFFFNFNAFKLEKYITINVGRFSFDVLTVTTDCDTGRLKGQLLAFRADGAARALYDSR